MKWSHKVVGTAFGFLALAAIGIQPVMADGSLDRVKKQGYVNTAVNQELPYAELKSNGEMVGVLPEVVEAVLAESGIGEFRGVLIDWGAMIPGLQARRYDMVSGGLYINPKRCKAIIFSEPILCDAESFLKLKSNPINITSFAELKNHPTALGATAPGSYEHLAAKNAGIPRDKLVLWEGNIQNGIQLIRTGRADLLLSPLSSNKDALSKVNDADKFEIIAPVTDVAGGCAAIGFHPNDRQLRDAFDAGLKRLQASGKFDEILKKWGASPEVVLATSREKKCGGVPN
ncbi:MAG TPA: ectoine/hydroxyectoine ABC transporter substrate-binding protein EhuB [Gammaproteobacteria bacterium]|nr:ectoine/hydroxyectoine ABC transporter substrate-binding protein EhuB [Gammaproteobacteria bacterium]HIN58582.1 ectoine/hydroxyectoine ABC transporter substrate-binding protein EhuB [Gammaproteobacteria bacterium]